MQMLAMLRESRKNRTAQSATVARYERDRKRAIEKERHGCRKFFSLAETKYNIRLKGHTR